MKANIFQHATAIHNVKALYYVALVLFLQHKFMSDTHKA